MRRQITPILLLELEKDLIRILDQFGPNSWDSTPVVVNGVDYTNRRNSLKEKITRYLIWEQEGYCAYCTVNLEATTYEVDHLAKKKPYHKLTWDVRNLLCVCTSCNIRKKGNRNFTQSPVGTNRNQICDPLILSYKIVHPILHNPDAHISWCMDKLFCMGAKTPEGHSTISKFELSSPAITLSRYTVQMMSGYRHIDQEFVKNFSNILRTKR